MYADSTNFKLVPTCALDPGIVKEVKIGERKMRNIETENTETETVIERKINMREVIKTKIEREDG